VDAIQKANSGHPGLPMGAAPMGYVLWTRHLKHNPANPGWEDRDRFVLSAGHGSMLLYSLLHLTGYDLSLEEIKQFRQWESKTPGHPERGLTPGVEVTTGPLGQGFANGVGMAIAERFLAARYNRPGHEIVNHCTYAVVSDGDLMEGIAAEAASLAGHLKLGKLIYLYDNNFISLAGTTDLSYTEDRAKRFEAYGWHVQSVADGNDLAAIDQALRTARAETGRPSIIITRTIIGYGSPRKQNTIEAHGSPLGPDEVKAAKESLGWPVDSPFRIPGEALEIFRQALDNGKRAEAEWKARFAAYEKAFPDLAHEFQTAMRGELPAGWDADIQSFPADAKGIATRAASGKLLNAIAPKIPTLIGGSADLNPSTNTALKGLGDFEPPDFDASKTQGLVGGVTGYGGRNIAFGVREHAMGAIANGLAAHGGILPFTATFFMFSDYMRPSIRLASLMGLHVIYVFTHDSIAVGEDGPTHEPIEHLAALRAIPHLTVIRPCDANETAIAWRVAVESNGPVALVFTRQNMPVLDRGLYGPAEGLRRGAYILSDAGNARPDLILIATGSEVQLAVDTQKKLQEQGIAARVVSMPSWELFEAQPQEYRDQVLPPSIGARLAIEAGVPQGWHKYVGDNGGIMALDRFGASAPCPVVFEKLGFTVNHVVDHAKKLLSKTGNEETMTNNPLLELKQLGQSIWLDNIRRGHILSGELKKLIDEDGISGETSNPAIFEKAIAGNSADYAAEMQKLVIAGKSAFDIYDALSIEDVRMACEVFRPIYDRTAGADGFVSIEVAPSLARKTTETIADAKRLFKAVNCPNVMIKIPGTPEGVPAIEECLYAGLNINITLLFSIEAYEAVAWAYIRALERRAAEGKPIDRIASVASFFVSRIDTLADELLTGKAKTEANPALKAKIEALRGKAAIANAKLAYQLFKKLFADPRFVALKAKGARVQRPLWASTSTKNPNYPDTLYVDPFIAPDTVNTLPPETVDAFRDHGKPKIRIEDDLDGERRILRDLESVGISMEAVTQQVLEEGIVKFAKAFDQLLASIEKKRS